MAIVSTKKKLAFPIFVLYDIESWKSNRKSNRNTIISSIIVMTIIFFAALFISLTSLYKT